MFLWDLTQLTCSRPPAYLAWSLLSPASRSSLVGRLPNAPVLATCFCIQIGISLWVQLSYCRLGQMCFDSNLNCLTFGAHSLFHSSCCPSLCPTQSLSSVLSIKYFGPLARQCVRKGNFRSTLRPRAHSLENRWFVRIPVCRPWQLLSLGWTYPHIHLWLGPLKLGLHSGLRSFLFELWWSNLIPSACGLS